MERKMHKWNILYPYQPGAVLECSHIFFQSGLKFLISKVMSGCLLHAIANCSSELVLSVY